MQPAPSTAGPPILGRFLMGENMTDLTKITTAFGLLDKETQEALKAHGGLVEQYTSCGWRDHAMHKVSYHPCVVYRAKPQPLTRPSIDWSHVATEYKWLARDESGDARIHIERPRAHRGLWLFGYDCTNASAFASYTPGTCDWRDSLVGRPE